MKKIILYTMCLLLMCGLFGCSNTPMSTCDSLKLGLQVAVYSIDAAIIMDPNKYTPADINEIQFWVDEAGLCINGYCADVNNPSLLSCATAAMGHLGNYQGPITLPVMEK